MINISDTLTVNKAMIESWRSDDAYNYEREILSVDINLYTWFITKLRHLYNFLFENPFYARYGTIFWIIVGILFVLAIVIFILLRRSSLFKLLHSTSSKDLNHGDDIYGIDFYDGIAKALKKKNYREAIRLIYLQTLRALSDRGKIEWEIFKTPTQYTLEVRSGAFLAFTNYFLQVRYGHFDADESLFREMVSLQTKIKEDLLNER